MSLENFKTPGGHWEGQSHSLVKLSDYLKKPVHEIYKILKDSDILDDYIIGCYDVLHTLGSEYLMEDITEIIKERGINLWGEVNEN